MSRRIVASLSAVAAAAALAGGAQTSHAEMKGHAWNTGPGGATRGECAGYAKAVNSLYESALVETGSNNDGEVLQTVALMEGLVNAGKARGCTFLGLPG